MYKIKIVIINILIFFFILILSLEFILPKITKVPHLVYYKWDTRPTTFFPSITHRAITNNYDIRFKTNSLGFKDTDINYTKNENTKRILLLGDSYIEAVGIAPDKQLGRVLEKLFDEENINLEVISMGMSGYGQNEQLVNYNLLGKKFIPDLVITFFCKNDIDDNLRTKDRYFNDSGELIFGYTNEKITLKQIFFRKFTNTFETYHIYKKILRGLYTKERVKLIKENKKIHKSFSLDSEEFKYLEKIVSRLKQDISVRDNIKLLNIIVSDNVTKKLNDEHYKILSMTEEIYKSLNIDTINTDYIFRKYYNEKNILPHWSNDFHWNENGNKLVAELIHTYLKNKNF